MLNQHFDDGAIIAEYYLGSVGYFASTQSSQPLFGGVLPFR